METLLTSLSNNGPVWTLVAILLMLVWLLIKLLLAEKDKRIQDATKNRDDLVVPISRMGESIERIERKVLISKGE